jgi:hypothetical protein
MSHIDKKMIYSGIMVKEKVKIQIDKMKFDHYFNNFKGQITSKSRKFKPLGKISTRLQK